MDYFIISDCLYLISANINSFRDNINTFDTMSWTHRWWVSLCKSFICS